MALLLLALGVSGWSCSPDKLTASACKEAISMPEILNRIPSTAQGALFFRRGMEAANHDGGSGPGARMAMLERLFGCNVDQYCRFWSVDSGLVVHCTGDVISPSILDEGRIGKYRSHTYADHGHTGMYARLSNGWYAAGFGSLQQVFDVADGVLESLPAFMNAKGIAHYRDDTLSLWGYCTSDLKESAWRDFEKLLLGADARLGGVLRALRSESYTWLCLWRAGGAAGDGVFAGVWKDPGEGAMEPWIGRIEDAFRSSGCVVTSRRVVRDGVIVSIAAGAHDR